MTNRYYYIVIDLISIEKAVKNFTKNLLMIFLKHRLLILLADLKLLSIIFLFKSVYYVPYSFIQEVLFILIANFLIHFFAIRLSFHFTPYVFANFHKLRIASISNTVHIFIWLHGIVKLFSF